MAPAEENDHPVIAENIRVERTPAGPIRLFIDGKLFSYAFASDDAHPLSVDLVANTVPGVRLTLLAKSVEVSDRLLENVELPGHESG